MRIKVEQEKLAKALNNVSKVAAGSRTTLAILNNVLIRVDDKKVTLTTTNLDMAVVHYLPVKECDNGVVTVPARFFAEFIGNLPRGEEIEIKTDLEKVITEAGEYSSVINGASADDFPELPVINEEGAAKFSIPVDDFKTGMAQVLVATSNDMTRPALTGIYFNTQDNALYAAATDGYRLSEKKLVDKVDAEVAAIVPATSVRNTLSLIDDSVETVEILFDESQVRFRLGEVELTSKLVDGSYPDYRQLIPKDNEVHTKIQKDELLRVTKIAALFSREVGGVITCVADPEEKKLIVSSVANELGENKSDIKAEVDGAAKTNLNSRYLLDYLNVMDEKNLSLNFSNNLDPILFHGENKDFRCIIMPLKGRDGN